MKIAITGATGFIGRGLVTALCAAGDQVVVLTRDAERATAVLGVDALTVVNADLQTAGPWTAALAGCDAVIHLAGESVAGARWSARQKQLIRDSRVEATRVIVEAIAALPAGARPTCLVSTSGTDYYPFALAKDDFDDDEVGEDDEPGDSFLARVCRDWEREALAAQACQVRVTIMRTGIVLGHGGALAKMTTPFKWFVGGRIGTGRQWISWIHVDDVIAGYLAAVRDPRYVGPINLITGSVRNAELARELGHAMGRRSWLPVPGFAVRAAAGELADYLLQGRRVVPRRLQELGFVPKFPSLPAALQQALR